MNYLCVIERETHADGHVSYGGYCLDLSANVVSKPSREAVIESLREGMALSQLHFEEYGLPVPPPLSKEADVVREHPDDELVWLEPAPVNPISLEIERLLQKMGMNRAELARRLGVHRAQATRLTDPFYFGHSVTTLQRVADAVGAQLKVELVL